MEIMSYICNVKISMRAKEAAKQAAFFMPTKKGINPYRTEWRYGNASKESHVDPDSS